MSDKDTKKDKRIKKARKNRFKWTICTFLVVFFLLFLVIELGKYMPFEIFLPLLFSSILLVLIIIWYYLYIQFFATLYRCKYCNLRFYVGFWKWLIKDFFTNSTHERIISIWIRLITPEDQKIKSYSYWEFKVKCPCCKKKLWARESVYKKY